MLLRDLVIDACGVMNLLAADAADQCLPNIDPTVQMPQPVEGECVKEPTLRQVTDLIARGLLARMMDALPPETLVEFMDQHDLGAGESAVILSCQPNQKHVWCDDGKARRVAIEVVGAERVTVTIGILLELRRLGHLTSEQAYGLYQTMIECGARFPNIPRERFSE